MTCVFSVANIFSQNYLYTTYIPGDSLAEGPKILSIKHNVMFVSQLTDDELTIWYYQQDGAKCRTSNASMREIGSFFFF